MRPLGFAAALAGCRPRPRKFEEGVPTSSKVANHTPGCPGEGGGVAIAAVTGQLSEAPGEHRPGEGVVQRPSQEQEVAPAGLAPGASR